MMEWTVTCGMLVRQVLHCYFHFVDLHPHAGALGEQVDIAARTEIKMLCEFVEEGVTCSIFFFIFPFVHTHMSAILTLMCFGSS